MNQHGIGLDGSRAGDRGTIEPVVERMLRLIAEREAAQGAIARDRMGVPFDAVANVVELAGERLPDAGAVIAMSDSAHGAGDQGGAEQALGVYGRLEGSRPKGGAKTPDLAPCGGRERTLAPAPGGDRDYVIDAGMQARQRRIILLHHPGQPGIGQMPARIGDGRHVVDHVTERGGLDEQNLGHRWGGFAGPHPPRLRERVGASGRSYTPGGGLSRDTIPLTQAITQLNPATESLPLA